eukprot:g2230.t1
MDTAEDMAESISDVPAKDIKSKDDTTKVLGETVFKDGVEDMEELEAEDPFLEQPIEDLAKDSKGLTATEKKALAGVETELKEADKNFEEEEAKDAATEAVFSSRDQDMKQLDENGDGVLDNKEVAKEIDHDMKEADQVSMLQQMKLETPALKHLIAIFDKNGDGELTFDELFGRESPAKQKEYKAAFEMVDQDKSKSLDVQELFDLHNQMWMKRWIEPKMFFKMKAKDHINVMDTNGDGKIDWPEFAAFMKPHIEEAMKEYGEHNLAYNLPQSSDTEAQTMEEHLKKFKALFDEADINHDGSLSEDEMVANLKDREEWMAYAAATGVIHKADDNHDNTLSLNEVIKNADKFGAKTEDFFEDQDLLNVEDGDGGDAAGASKGGTESTFVKKSLRGGNTGDAPA